MDSRRFGTKSSVMGRNRTLVTDSMVLQEDAVADALADEKENAGRGDIIVGLRNGLILSAGIWALFIAIVFFVF